MKEFTVVLLRPEYTADPLCEPDSYVGLMKAPTRMDAVRAAQQEVFRADHTDKRGTEHAHDKQSAPEDYLLVVVFDGRHEPTLFGWQPEARL